MIYDAAIIGGGLAGLSLSIDLVKRGKRVVVFEKGDYPRHKVCGEYISLESRDYLYSICPELETMNLPVIDKFTLTSTGTKQFNTRLDLGGFGISRYLLEEALYNTAKRNGVTIYTKSKVNEINFNSNGIHFINLKDQVIQSRVICNSTGRKSNFEVHERKLHESKTNYIGIKYHLKLKRDRSAIEIHNFPGGYCGISAIENDKFCMCYIVNSNYLKSSQNSIREMEGRYLFQNKNIKSIYESAKFLYDEPLTISGINFNIKQTTSVNTFYLGDASGSIAPITGNGMSMALRSASKLSAELHRHLDGKISIEEVKINYNRFWDDHFSRRIKLSRTLQKLSESPTLANLSIGVFNLLPSISKAVIRSTHGSAF